MTWTGPMSPELTGILLEPMAPNLSVRAVNALLRAGLYTVEQVKAADLEHDVVTMGPVLMRFVRERLGAAHPESCCQQCGGLNVCWHAPNDVWNSVMEGLPHGIVCPLCFVKNAEAKGWSDAWRLTPTISMSLPNTQGDADG